MRVAISFVLAAIFFGSLLADYMLTSEARKMVEATCKTQVSFDKSGDYYCMETSGIRHFNRP